MIRRSIRRRHGITSPEASNTTSPAPGDNSIIFDQPGLGTCPVDSRAANRFDCLSINVSEPVDVSSEITSKRFNATSELSRHVLSMQSLTA
jgi:hypothetical protein